MHKIILNERNLCHDDLGKKKVKYAAKYDAINPDKKSEILKKIIKKVHGPCTHVRPNPGSDWSNPQSGHVLDGEPLRLRHTNVFIYV